MQAALPLSLVDQFIMKLKRKSNLIVGFGVLSLVQFRCIQPRHIMKNGDAFYNKEERKSVVGK
jgi:hypothetical protein